MTQDETSASLQSSSGAPTWSLIARNYEDVNKLSRVAAHENHPLTKRKPNKTQKDQALPQQQQLKTRKSVIPTNLDPLSDVFSSSVLVSADADPLSSSVSISNPLYDPLSSSLGNDQVSNFSSANNERQLMQEIHDDKINTPWRIKKQQILQEYEIQGSITGKLEWYNSYLK